MAVSICTKKLSFYTDKAQMELFAPYSRMIVSPIEAYPPGCTKSFKRGPALIRITGPGEYTLKFIWNEWYLDARQVFMFDLWFKIVDEFSIKHETNCFRLGPWAVTDSRLMYGFNIVDHVMQFRLYTYDNEYDFIYSVDGNYRYNISTHDVEVIIAITMTLNGNQYLY